MTLGAVALLIQYESLLAGVAAAVVAVALVAGAIVLSRAQHEPEAAVAVAWMGCVYAALGGLMLVLRQDVDFFGYPVACAGAGALVAGLICVVGLGEGRTLALPPVVVGAIFLATGLLTEAGSFDPAVVLTTALAIVVLAGSVFPWLALGVTGTKVDQLFAPADITADPAEIDPARVGADARVAHQILVAVSATVGLLLVLVAPLAVSLGSVRHAARGGRLPGRDAAHPAVPHRPRGARRPGLRHPRPGLGRDLAAVDASRLAAHRGGHARRHRRGPARGHAASPAPRRCGAAGSATSPRPSACWRCCRSWCSRPASTPRSGARAMATKKDLVEAYSFSRRRLVTAFLSGAPGGREVEPSRPGRTVVGGLALAVLLIAGAAIASVLASRTEEDWNKVGLVVSREEAAPYVILDESEDPTLIPVINITSAQLILGVERAEPTYVSQDVIEDQTPGDPIGIAGAPQTLPRPKQFIESGWTSCTDDRHRDHDGRLRRAADLDLARTSAPWSKSDDAYYVLATSSDDDDHQRTYRYPVPVPRNPANDPADGLLLALGIEDVRSEATEVPLDWLNLFPEGGVLGADSFDFEDGGKLLNEEGYPSEARVGDYIEDGNRPALVLTSEGPSALSDFALAVLKNTLFTKRKEPPNPVEMERPSAVATERTYTDAPVARRPACSRRTGEPCARLVARTGDVPRVRLAEEPRGAAVPDPTVPADQKTVVIDPGHGAFVRIGDWDDTEGGDAYVIDPRGKTYLARGPEHAGEARLRRRRRAGDHRTPG